MKASFIFDGHTIKLRLDIEDPMERALARLMEAYNVADVSVQRESYSGYGEDSIKAISIHLRKPEQS